MVNQTFDYRIPERFTGIVQPGMRVVIPFGPRKITGFVMALHDESQFGSLKDIIDVLDMIPVLTEELLFLGRWLAEETLSLYITTYKAMLPQALRSSYDKEIERIHGKTLPINITTYFGEKKSVSYDDFIDHFGHQTLKQMIEHQLVHVKYVVTSNITKQYKTMLLPKSKEKLEAIYES